RLETRIQFETSDHQRGLNRSPPFVHHLHTCVALSWKIASILVRWPPATFASVRRAGDESSPRCRRPQSSGGPAHRQLSLQALPRAEGRGPGLLVSTES